MNENKYLELLVKTASYDPATMLLHKMAAPLGTAAQKAMQASAPLWAKNPATKKTIMDIIKGVLNKGTQYVADNAAKLGDDITGLGKGIVARRDPLIGTELGAWKRKELNQEIVHRLAQILKNPLTIGAGVAGAGTAAAGAGAGYAGYKALSKGKGSAEA